MIGVYDCDLVNSVGLHVSSVFVPIIHRGHPAYGAGVKHKGSGQNTNIGATYYMTYHTVLQKDQQYIDALNYSLNLAKDIENTIKANCTTCNNIAVFPYR